MAIYLLLIALFAVSIFYNYPAILQMQPQGAHLWRQADCMAMTQNYRQFHLPFLQPATYNLQSLNGNVAGESPVFYFIAAQFKNPVFALRLMHTVIFILGIIATYFIAFYFLHRRLLSLFCSILMFTSPLLVFYGNNFLSDVPALSFAFMGWAFFLNGHKKDNLFYLGTAFFCFTFAALLKASEVMNLVIVMVYLIQFRQLNSKLKTSILFSLFSFLIICSWYFFAKSYNQQNHDTYYFLSVAPIWKLSAHEIGLGIWRMLVSNSKNYFWRPASILLLLSVYFLITKRKKINNELKLLISSAFALTILYVLVFYGKMIGHEYYYIPFFVFVLFGIIGILKVYNSYHAENIFIHAFAYLFLVINIIYCKNFAAEKLTVPLYNGYLSSNEMQEFLNKNGVTKYKSVISLPDETTNKTLYQIKRKGFTGFNNDELILKNREADFLLADENFLQQQKKLQPFLKDSVGYFNGFVLYKLK